MSATTSTRRGFLGMLTVVLGSIPVLGGLFVALRAGLAPAHSDKPARIPLCRLADVPDDGILQRSVSYQMRRGPEVESVARVVFVTRDPDGGAILAMAGECTHLGCPVHERDLKENADPDGPPLLCPCHGGKFSRTGERVAGPPKAPLRRFRLELPQEPDGMIYLLDV